MKRFYLLLAVAAALLLLASCNSPLGGYVTVKATGADAAAYRQGDEDWISADNPEDFSFWALGPYEVAVRCGDTVNVLALTPDIGNPMISCDTGNRVGFSVSYNISAVNGAAKAALYYRAGVASGTGTSGTISASNAIPGLQDIVLVAEDSNGDPIAAKMITENVINGASYSMTMSSSDTGNILAGGRLDDFSASVPAGWTLNGALTASVTPHGTTVLTKFMNSSGGTYDSFTFADYDVVTLFAKQKATPPYLTLSRIVVGTDKALHFTAPLPAVFNATMQHDYLPTFSGLSYAGEGLVGFHLQARWGGYVISALVSTDFLKGATSYEIPDLIDLDGFEDFMPNSGDTVTTAAEAICSNKSFAEMAGVPLNSKPTVLKGLDLRIAGDVEQYTAP